MNANGPAIWGGCVPAFCHKKRDGALFAVMVQIFLSITGVAVQAVSEPEFCQGAGFKLLADARTLSGAKGGCKNQYESVLGAGTKAKSVTNPLIIPFV